VFNSTGWPRYYGIVKQIRRYEKKHHFWTEPLVSGATQMNKREGWGGGAAEE